MSQMSQMSQSGLGNTKPNRERGRRYTLVLNNYSNEEKDELENKLSQMSQYFVIGEEVGESGTPHLQGYVEFKNQVDFSVLKKINSRIHWEKAIATRKKNYIYCTKENKFIEHKVKTLQEEIKEERLSEYKDVVWKDWQREILELVESPVNNRKIYWFWESIGNVGKSFVADYLCLTYNVILANGKKDDILNQVKTTIIDNNIRPKLILLDIPRYNEGYINYGVIEQLKNAVIYSGKYEGGQVIVPKMHVIVFANHEPDYSKMSEDRWVVKEVEKLGIDI